MHILVTNDDGVQAPGLLALAQAIRPLGKVTVFAPDHNWSASGHVKTLDRPLRVRETVLTDGSHAYMCDGAPSDCVALPLLGFLKEKIDLLVSGINPTANIGHDVTYSGTVTAAMEAVINGIPGIAVSLDTPAELKGALDYSTAAWVGRHVTEQALADNLPKDVVLNVNVPYRKQAELSGFMVTRQGLRVYRDALDAHRPARTALLLDRRRSAHRRGGGRHRRGRAGRGLCLRHTPAIGFDPLQSDGYSQEVEILI